MPTLPNLLNSAILRPTSCVPCIRFPLNGVTELRAFYERIAAIQLFENPYSAWYQIGQTIERPFYGDLDVFPSFWEG